MQTSSFNIVSSPSHHHMTFKPPPPSVTFQPHFTPHRRGCRQAPLRCCTHNNHDNNHSSAAFKNYQKLFISQRLETTSPIRLKLVAGHIPDDFPTGTYYLIGPGIFTDDHGSTVNPLDGHGYLRAFEVTGNREVQYSAKYVKTAAYEEEHHEDGKWKFTHRGPFSVLKGGRMVGNFKVMKNVANTTVLKWGGRLFCLWEGGVPYEIEPESLDTIGKCDLINGYASFSSRLSFDLWDIAAKLLKPVLCGLFKMPARRLLSHYKIDHKRNRLIVVSCNAEDMVIPRSHFTFYEFDTNFELIQKQEFIIQDHLMIHDWAFTDTHYIVMGNRVKLNNIAGILRALCGVSPMQSLLTLNPSNTTSSPVYLLKRSTSSPDHNPNKEHSSAAAINPPSEQEMITICEVPQQFWTLHCANAFEEPDDDANLRVEIHAVVCSYQWFSFERMFGYDYMKRTFDPTIMNAKGQGNLLPRLVKISINLRTSGKGRKVCSVEHLGKWKRPCDYPIINLIHNGTRNKYTYSTTTLGTSQELSYFPFNTIVKLNICTRDAFIWLHDSESFIGEPIFIPKTLMEQEEIKKGEDDGYLLVVDYSAGDKKCYILVLDPKYLGEHRAFIARFEVPEFLSFPLGFHGTWSN